MKKKFRDVRNLCTTICDSHYEQKVMIDYIALEISMLYLDFHKIGSFTIDPVFCYVYVIYIS